jgi:hypothetical protein
MSWQPSFLVFSGVFLSLFFSVADFLLADGDVITRVFLWLSGTKRTPFAVFPFNESHAKKARY